MDCKVPIVIDNVFEDPHKIRKIVLNSLAEEHDCILNDNQISHPGIRHYAPQEVSDELYSNLAKIINVDELKLYDGFQAHITSAIHGVGLIHTDPTKIAGLVYLNEDPPENSGTIFCKYVGKNVEDVRIKPLFPKAATTRDVEVIESYARIKQEFNDENFVIEKEIKNKFNRMVIYDGLTPHAPYKGFGNNLYNSRLVIVFWFDEL